MSTYDLSKLIDQVIPDDDVSEGKELLEALKPAGKPPSNYDRERLLELLEEADRRDKYGGLRKWFRPGTPYGIDKLPKHKAFFDAGAVHNERFFCAGNRCKIAGTKVLMADGYEKNIEDVVVGDKVLAYDIGKAALVESNVIDTYRGKDVAYLYDNRRGRPIGSTKDHEYLSVSQRGILRKRSIGELAETTGVWAVLPTAWEREEVDPGFSEDVAKLLGLLTGDGHLCALDDAFKFTNNSLELCEFAVRVAEAEVGGKARLYKQDTFYDVVFSKGHAGNSKSPMYYLLKETGLYGSRSGNKEVPTQIMRAPKGHIRAYLQGLLAADGCCGVRKCTLYTTSEKLAQGVKSLLLALGVHSSIASREHRNPRHSTCYTVMFCGKDSFDKVGPIPTKPYKVNKDSRKRRFPYGVRPKLKKCLGEVEVFCITVDHPDHLFVANGYIVGNSGKSVAGAYETACHLTGLYPDWWEGRRFDGPINAWACGKTGKVTRDTVQKELLGAGEMGMGMIPKNLIHKMWAKPGTAKAVDILQVVHTSGGISSLTFKSYEEKVTSFYGDARHVVWMDEEADEYIYSECFLRTSQLSDCPEGGIIYTTFTPKQGITPFVLSFLKDCEYLADSPRVMLTEEELAESE